MNKFNVGDIVRRAIGCVLDVETALALAGDLRRMAMRQRRQQNG